MKKIYLGSGRLKNNYRLFRVKYGGKNDGEKVKEEIMRLMEGYLQKHDGKLLNIKNMIGCGELLVYFVTGEEAPHPNWQHYIKNVLLKQYNVTTSAIQIGPNAN